MPNFDEETLAKFRADNRKESLKPNPPGTKCCLCLKEMKAEDIAWRKMYVSAMCSFCKVELATYGCD